MFLCHQRRHGPGQRVLKGHQARQVIAVPGVVPGAGPQEPQPEAPAELPQVDEQGVGQQARRQRPAAGKQRGAQPLHQEEGRGVHGQGPQAAVSGQPPVPGVVPVTRGGEGHFAEAAVQGVDVDTGPRGERLEAGAVCGGLYWRVRIPTGSCRRNIGDVL